MAYIAPTPADLKARYPALAAVADATVQVWIDDAAIYIDDAWPDDVRRVAVMAWAAHKLVEIGAVGGAIPLGVTSFRSGSFSATVSDKVAGLTGADSTIYGREFLTLRRTYFTGPIMAWTPPAADYV